MKEPFSMCDSAFLRLAWLMFLLQLGFAQKSGVDVSRMSPYVPPLDQSSSLGETM